MPEARLYIGETATEDQRRELEAIFSGKKSGHLESLWGATIDEWLPAKVASIAIAWGEKPTLSVDGFGQATMRPISNGAGKATLTRSIGPGQSWNSTDRRIRIAWPLQLAFSVAADREQAVRR